MLPVQYAQTPDLQARYDFRLTNQASSDDNSGSQNTANQNIALQDASSEINTAILAGGRYTPTQISTLLSGGDTLLVRLCCDIAFARLLARRRGGASPGQKDNLEAAQKLLDRLESGAAILNISASIAAGLPSMVMVNADQASNAEPLSSCEFLGGPAGTKNTSTPYPFGSAGYGGSQSFDGGI